MQKLSIFIISLFISYSALADECVGSGAYRICTNATQNSQGDETVKSYDNQGNEYSITSGSRENDDGSTEAFSVDSEGNRYSIKSWCDDDGCHTEDTEGNKCTVTKSGEMIGC